MVWPPERGWPRQVSVDGEVVWVATWEDEVAVAQELLESYWGRFGYFGDEWEDAWRALHVTSAAKQHAWNTYHGDDK